MKESNKVATHVEAAGGIVIRDLTEPLIAIVRLRKDGSWVLPKRKLKQGEQAEAAAKREVEEETGHDVTVLGFLGALSHVADRKHKIVQFWHMHASAAPVRALMDDVKAVKWLPLRKAIKALTRPHERVFLSNVGPAAIRATADSRRAVPAAPPLAPEPQPARLRPHRVLGGTIRAWLKQRLALGRQTAR